MAIVSRTVDNGSGTDIDVAVDARGGTTDDVQVIGLIRSDADTLVTATADGVLVNLGTNNDVTVTGTVTANAGTNLNTSALALESGGNLAALAASAAVIDDWDESDRAKVNPIVGQAGVAAGAGNVGATVQRVTLAADDPAVVDLAAIEVLLTSIDADTGNIATSVGTLDNAISGNEMQVDVVTTVLAKSATATAKSLNSGTSSAEFCASNTDRTFLTMTNTDANRCYVNVGAAASATAFVVYLDEGDYYELPAGITGAVNAIWAGDGSGALIGQEFD